MICNILELTVGTPIKICDSQVIIHQPTIKEISFFNEKRFFNFLGFFLPSKDDKIDDMNLSEEEAKDLKVKIKEMGELEFFLSMINLSIDLEGIEESKKKMKLFEVQIDILQFFNLILEEQKCSINEDGNFIISNEKGGFILLNDQVFVEIRETCQEIFNYNKLFKGENFNTQSKKAKEIADKIKNARERVNRQKDHVSDSILSSMIINLSIGEKWLPSEIENNFTIYKLFQYFDTFYAYYQHNIQVQSKLAGATNVEIIDWFNNS